MRDDLPRAMRETASRLEPDIPRLAAGGVSRGTRMRRIERAVQILGSAVAVAAVFAGVTIFGAQRATTAPTVTTAPKAPTQAAPTTAAAPTTQTAPTPTETTPPPTATGGQLIAALKTSLAGTNVTGAFFAAVGTDSPPPTTTVPVNGAILVDAQLTIAKSVGFLSITFSGPRSLVRQQGMPKTLSDDSVVYISQGPGYSDGSHPDRVDLQVTLVRPDGSSLAAVETNAPSLKSAAPRPGSPLLLTPDQVVTVLDSSVWDDALAAAGALAPADDAGHWSSPSSPDSTPFSPS